ncbi:MAG: hypothetical protein WCT01_03210 [Candidatus Shapirobacteria bacterium]
MGQVKLVAGNSNVLATILGGEVGGVVLSVFSIVGNLLKINKVAIIIVTDIIGAGNSSKSGVWLDGEVEL